MMFCPDCGKVFYKKVDFYEHLVYNEGYNEEVINRLMAVGLLDNEDKMEIMKIIKEAK